MKHSMAGRTGGLRLSAVVAAATLAVVGLGTAAQAQGEEIGGTGRDYLLTNSDGPVQDHRPAYGRPEDRAYAGDWDGDGRDSLAVRRGSTYYLNNDVISGGAADVTLTYGRAADVVLVGDWDGDGVDTLAVRRGNVYHLKNSLAGGPADVVVPYGRSTDAVLVGDWDGDGIDTLAVRRGNVYYVKNSLAAGAADQVVAYGRVSDPVLVGDWDGDGDDSLAVRRGATFHLRNTLGSGPADREVVYGRSGDAAFAGDWNGDGTDTLGVRRGSCNVLASTTANTSSGSNPFLNLSTIVGSTMRVADERCYERVEFEFRGAGPVPGWQAGYVDVIRSDGSGDPIQPPLEGVASLQVTYGAWNTGEPAGQPPFSGPSRIVTSGYDALREARSVSGFEGISDLGIGLDRVRPYMVQWSVDPARGTTRLVVYIYTG